jgi:hypothetical protein
MMVDLGGAETSGAPGAEEFGTGLEAEASAVFFFFLGAVGAKGSVRPASSVSPPVLLAPVSRFSGGETMSSSVR